MFVIPIIPLALYFEWLSNWMFNIDLVQFMKCYLLFIITWFYIILLYLKTKYESGYIGSLNEKRRQNKTLQQSQKKLLIAVKLLHILLQFYTLFDPKTMEWKIKGNLQRKIYR